MAHRFNIQEVVNPESHYQSWKSHQPHAIYKGRLSCFITFNLCLKDVEKAAVRRQEAIQQNGRKKRKAKGT